jgi:hypothetical protein
VPGLSDFITALGLVFIIEGLIVALAPGRLRQLMDMIATLPPDVLRRGGLMFAFLGLGIVWLVRG